MLRYGSALLRALAAARHGLVGLASVDSRSALVHR